ncbi:MAG: ATP-binding protein [Deltaproteobacteria bacterium]|nr:ATP-binding protein [Deltaproteobacteria bacterium]
MSISRPQLFKRLLPLDLPPGQSAFLWGPRKSGKTTLLRERFPDAAYFDLLDSDLYLDLLRRPARLRELVAGLMPVQRQQPIIIDEVQKIPLLLDEVHLMIERDKLNFILCGSSARKLKKGQANLLGGRAWRFLLHPLSAREIPDFDLLRALQWGLLPSHYLSQRPKRSLNAYVMDYLNEEIRAEGLTRNLPAFSRFLDVVGFSVGELVNYSNIARDVGVSSKTVKEYFQILVDTYLAYLVEPLALRGGRQVITATPRFYLFDTGVANRLAKRSIATLAGSEAGRAFENLVLMELLASRSYLEQDHDIRFWRTKNGLEVDFILTGRDMVAIEVKLSSRVDRAQLKGLLAFCKEQRPKRAWVVSLERRKRVIKTEGLPDIEVLPFQEFLDELWGKR